MTAASDRAILAFFLRLSRPRPPGSALAAAGLGIALFAELLNTGSKRLIFDDVGG
jgi:hypothetical protein